MHTGKPGTEVSVHMGKPGTEVSVHTGKPGTEVSVHTGKPGTEVSVHTGKPGTEVSVHTGKPGTEVSVHMGKCAHGQTGNIGDMHTGSREQRRECTWVTGGSSMCTRANKDRWQVEHRRACTKAATTH